MDYKRFCKLWLILTLSLTVLCGGLFVLTDPLGILETPIIQGVNNYKTKQGSYKYIFKPYEAAKTKAEVYFIGTSRVYVGWQATWPGYEDAKVYNFAVDGLSFSHMKKHSDMLYTQCCPQKLFIGIDFFQFGKGNFYNQREHFSEERLDDIVKGMSFRQKMQDTVSTGLHSIRSTLYNSWKHRKGGIRFLRGFDCERGNSGLNLKSDKATMKQYRDTYAEFKYEPQAMETLKSIISDAQQHGTQVYVFVNPIHKRLYDLLCSYGHEAKWQEIKAEVRQFCGRLYELQNADKYISDDNLYYDASHYNRKLGDIFKQQILEAQ